MEQEKWIRKLETVSGELNEGCKGFLIEAAKNLKGLRYYPDGIKDLTHTIRELSYYTKIDQLIGEDLHCMLICGLNEREPEDEGERITKDRSDLLIRFAQILQRFGDDVWSPSVTARFEKGLDNLEKTLRQGPTDEQDEIVEEVAIPIELLPQIAKYREEQNLETIEEAIVGLLQRVYEKEMQGKG